MDIVLLKIGVKWAYLRFLIYKIYFLDIITNSEHWTEHILKWVINMLRNDFHRLKLNIIRKKRKISSESSDSKWLGWISFLLKLYVLRKWVQSRVDSIPWEPKMLSAFNQLEPKIFLPPQIDFIIWWFE